MSKLPVTVGILTRNSAPTLADALKSVSSFAEVIVSDGGSTDGTIETAQRHGARVIAQRPELVNGDGQLVDFAGAMNQMLDEAGQPWFYKLDSDESLSDQLVAELAAVLVKAHDVDAFRVPFKYVVDGVVIEHASTYPASEPRLFRILPDLRYTRPVHERLPIDDERTGLLTQPHLKPLPPAREMARKWVRYMAIEARLARGTGLAQWRVTNYRRHRWSARHLAKQYAAIVRARRHPRLPARYEVLRIANDIVSIPVTAVAAAWGDRRSRSAELR